MNVGWKHTPQFRNDSLGKYADKRIFLDLNFHTICVSKQNEWNVLTRNWSLWRSDSGVNSVDMEMISLSLMMIALQTHTHTHTHNAGLVMHESSYIQKNPLGWSACLCPSLPWGLSGFLQCNYPPPFFTDPLISWLKHKKHTCCHLRSQHIASPAGKPQWEPCILQWCCRLASPSQSGRPGESFSSTLIRHHESRRWHKASNYILSLALHTSQGK